MKKRIALAVFGIGIIGLASVYIDNYIVYASVAEISEYIKEEHIELIQDGELIVPDAEYSFDQDDIKEDKIITFDDASDMPEDTAEQIAAQKARANDNETLGERKEACAIAVYNAMSTLETSINVSQYALTRSELQEVISNVVNSNPELFYIRNGYGVKTFSLSSTDKTEIVRECLGL